MEINIYEYIFKRENIPEAFFNVREMVSAYGYGEYANIVCDRIADSILQNDKHVQIDFANFPDILVDYVGIVKCEDILSGYIDIEEIEKIEAFFFSTHELVMINNSMLELLRKMSLYGLLKMMRESMTSNLDDVKEKRFEIGKMVLAEIVSRNIVNKIIQKVKSEFLNIVYRIKYRDIYAVLRKFEKEMSCDLQVNEE